MEFHIFAQKLSLLEQTASRLEMTRHLAELFKLLSHDEIPAACYLMQGSLVPEYQRLEFQLSDKMVVRALEQLSTQELAARYKQVGDIGILAQEVLEKQQLQQEQELQHQDQLQKSLSAELSILTVYSLLEEIAKQSGQGSQQRKLDLLRDLLLEVTPLSARFIARMVVGKLRLGFSTMTMIDALSWSKHENKSDSEVLEAAFNRRADIGVLAQSYLNPEFFVNEIPVTLGIPVMPALCQRLNSAAEIIEKMGEVYAEPKYDGLRIQIHINKTTKKITAHTRNLDDVSHMFPELKVAFEVLDAEQIILDGEAIGYDSTTNSLRAFQETSTRRRKHDVDSQSEKIPMRFYIYDILLIDSKSLLDASLRERKDLLSKLIQKNEVFFTTPYIQTCDPIELRTFHEEQLAAGFEGAVIKKVESPYISGRKGWSWVKIKEEEGTTGKLADTVDCVVMGYYAGRGKRTQFGLGALLVGVRDAATDSYKTVAKIGTGVSEEQLVTLKKMCDEHAVQTMPSEYSIPKALVPDVLVAPKIVLEIAADEVTNSPLHTAGQALRFPRLIKVRADKAPQQATTITELEKLKQLQ